MMCKKMLIIISCLFLLSCGKSKKEEKAETAEKSSDVQVQVSESNSGGTVNTTSGMDETENEILTIVQKWNSDMSNKDLNELESLAGSKVEYYQKSLTKNEYLATLKRFFDQNNVYGQEIKGNIEVKKLSEKQVKASFIKEVTQKTGVREYETYLVFEKSEPGWELILENDANSSRANEKTTFTENTASTAVKPTVTTAKTEIKKTETKKMTEASSKKRIGAYYETYSTDGYINVRAGASKETEIIDQLRNGVKLQILGNVGNWMRVSYGGGTGYIHNSQMRKISYEY